ncbi:MAG: YdeI/OmpD-associated family protein [Acidobacteriota bacterium]|nr:YdeI/OmpD-associated family protein [Acidobacteriota bacterium]
MAAKVKRFRAVLEPLGDGLGWVVAWLPFDAAKVWTQMVRQRVTVEVGGEVFRTSLFAGVRRKGQFVLVNKKMQRVAGAGVGAMVEFAITPDLEERPAELPDDLAALLDEEPGLREWYDGLTEYMRREIGKWVMDVKSDEARMRRAEQMAERLLATMEGERELPPVLAAAFRERPRAKAGWAKMTPAQRRGELMAVFYYQTPEARQKRADKLCDAAEIRSTR